MFRMARKNLVQFFYTCLLYIGAEGAEGKFQWRRRRRGNFLRVKNFKTIRKYLVQFFYTKFVRTNFLGLQIFPPPVFKNVKLTLAMGATFGCITSATHGVGW